MENFEEKKDELLATLQRKEALKRLNALVKKGLIEDAVTFFTKGDIAIFENLGGIADAVLYSLEINKYQEEYAHLKKEIDEFQKKYTSIVYLVQLSHTSYGDVYSFFYVSKEEDEWEYDFENLENESGNFYPYTYVYNRTIPEFSEFGRIECKISTAFGGVVRVG